jgi:hypothetical protein
VVLRVLRTRDMGTADAVGDECEYLIVILLPTVCCGLAWLIYRFFVIKRLIIYSEWVIINSLVGKS